MGPLLSSMAKPVMPLQKTVGTDMIPTQNQMCFDGNKHQQVYTSEFFAHFCYLLTIFIANKVFIKTNYGDALFELRIFF